MGKRTRAAGMAHRTQLGLTRAAFHEKRRPPEADAHHESGHAVVGWLYGAGFVQDPVVEIGTASDRQWSATHPDTGERLRYVSTAVTHVTRVTAPAGIPLDRFDVGALRRLTVGLLAGPMAEGAWWATQGRTASFEELVGLSQTKVVDRNSDIGQALELSIAVVILVSELHQAQQTAPALLPANWFEATQNAGAMSAANNEVSICTATAAALLLVPPIAAAHHACVAHLLDHGSLSQAALDAACAPLGRLRVAPPPTIARDGRAAFIALMDPARCAAQ